mmetsp:Transcript_114598/g.304647  ORF Transcript_114598/g.304647 Transcript_114598/m.304647 type:complete len:513 (-) Transcript_114598:60-1598(-)
MAARAALAALWWGSAVALRLDQLLSEVTDPIPALQGCEGLTCIEKYIAFDDGAFKWAPSGRGDKGTSDGGVGWQSYSLSLTSQAWMAKETRKEAWTHHIEIIVPDNFQPESKSADVAVLFIEKTVLTYAATEMAVRTGAITVALTDVPNSGLQFPPSGRYSLDALDENDLHGWTWRQYAGDPSHPEWPLEMPIAKTVVRAMDAVVAYTHTLGGGREVNRFVITGHSKRATATYMAGAVDSRIAGIIPVGEMADCFRAWEEFAQDVGGIVPVLLPFENQGALNLTLEQVKHLSAIVAPVNYIDRLTMPKFAIFAGADDFWPPDATRSWWGRLPNPKSMFVYGNGRHLGYERMNEGDGGILAVAAGFVSWLLSNSSMPEIEWKIQEDGSIAVRQVSDHTPSSVTVVGAKTKDGEARDFRGNDLMRNGWMKYGPLAPLAGHDRTWLAKSPENFQKLPPKDFRWCGFYVELEYESPRPGGPPLRLTTEVSVVPNTRPFPDATLKDPKYHQVVYQGQ